MPQRELRSDIAWEGTGPILEIQEMITPYYPKTRLCSGLKTAGLEWAAFQIMRRTHATLSRQAGIDPKIVADQRGHGLGVNLDVYTIAALDKRQHAVEVLEASL